METIVKIMIGINLIGFLYRVNSLLSVQFVNMYPIINQIYNELYLIIALLIILYIIAIVIYIYCELLLIKNIINDIKSDIILLKNNISK